MPKSIQQNLAELVCQRHEGTGDSSPDGYSHQECGGMCDLWQTSVFLQ